MYPNPQDVLPLPPRPDVHHYRKRAKDLVRACRSGEEALLAWAEQWVRDLIRLQPESHRAEQRSSGDRLVRELAGFAREQLARADCALSQAQFVIARAHGFGSWPKLARHLDALAAPTSSIWAFEEAADAIVAGDLPELDRLLAGNAGLAHARSTREHHATLLHYVSANGIENYRQETPSNVVEVARRLLDAGAEVDAEADVYGGGVTPLELVLTSAHPRRAGVQNDLADLLLERGARMPAGLVRSCLANGCPEAALHVARRGSSLSLEEAAGLGWLDEVGRFFDGVRAGVSKKDSTAALHMACWYDRREVVAFLLDRGIEVAARDERDGCTALHVAAYLGNPGLVELLLQRGAPVGLADDVYGTPPLVWALHPWLAEGRRLDDPRRAVLTMLLDAGAEVKPEWLDDPRLRAEPDLLNALLRRATPT
jgi:ankyrin repeat protein